MASSNPPLHYVIIGTGPAGDAAARHLRRCDPNGRITLITATKLLFIRRFDLYKVFAGFNDWRELLAHPPEYYEEHRLTVRRNTLVTQIDTREQRLRLGHKEHIHYDRLLVASGATPQLPEGLREYRALIHCFGTFEDAIAVRDALPEGGRLLMIGGDMMGIGLTRHLIAAGYEVTLVAGEQIFWPHVIAPDDRPQYVEALERMGVEVIQGRQVAHIEQGARGLSARRVVLDNEQELSGDVVMAFCGMAPRLDYLSGSGLDVQRGLLVDPTLATSANNIWAAGDVCQIWSAEEKRYQFAYEWKNVKTMGRIAACNMAGGTETAPTLQEGGLRINERNELDTPFWDYD